MLDPTIASPMNAFPKGSLGCNSIPFQFNEEKLNMMISGILPGSSPSVTVTTPSVVSEIVKATQAGR